MKTSELTGAALDWAVGHAQGLVLKLHGIVPYSTDWAQGGPLIERECIDLTCYADPRCGQGGFDAAIKTPEGTFESSGPTPLIAAMRCYVASRLGDEVAVPKELT